MTEAGAADMSVEAGEPLLESSPAASEAAPVSEPVMSEASPPPAEPIPASAPPPPPAPPAAPTGPGCPTCGKLRSDYGPGPVTRADGTQTLPAGRWDLNRPFSEWHPSDLDSYKPSISLKQIRKGDVAPPLSKNRGVGKGDYAQRDVMLKKIRKEGGWGYRKGQRPKVDIGHKDGPLWSKPPGAPVRKGLSPKKLNNAKSP